MKYKNKLFRKGRLMLAANEKGIYKTANRSNQDRKRACFFGKPDIRATWPCRFTPFRYNGTCESVEWRNDVGFQNKGNFGDWSYLLLEITLMEDVSGETKQSSPDTFFCTFCMCIFMRLAVFRGRMFPICLYCLTFFNTRTSSCFTGVWNGEKYKAYILKHKALILKYVPYVFF